MRKSRSIPGIRPIHSQRTGGYAKRGAQTPKTPHYARFVKRGIFRKPRKTPGFHRRPVCCYFSQLGSFRRFQDLGKFSFRSGGSAECCPPEKKARQNAIRCLGTHYMRLNLGVFWRLGRFIGLVYRRRKGFTTVTVQEGILMDGGMCQGWNASKMKD